MYKCMRDPAFGHNQFDTTCPLILRLRITPPHARRSARDSVIQSRMIVFMDDRPIGTVQVVF